MITYKILFLELIVFSYLYYIGSVTIVPSDTTFDIIEGDGYTIGIEDDDESNFCACKYNTNLDQTWINFDIKKTDCVVDTEPTLETATVLHKIEKASKSTVFDEGLSGRCLVTVKDVDDKSPTKWSVIPDDWNDTFTKQVDFNINFFYAVPLLFITYKMNSRDPPKVVVNEEEDFFQYLNTSLIFESCNVIFNGNTKQLNLKSEEIGVIETSNKIDQQLSERISSFGRDRCGFILKEVSPTDNITWTLTGITSDKKKYRALFDVIVTTLIPNSTLHKEQVVEVGSKYTLRCATDVGETNYCKIYDPKGKLVYTLDNITGQTRCDYNIGIFQVYHYGVWKCISGNPRTMKSIEYTFKFIEKESKAYMATWVEQKGDYLSIGCQFKETEISSINYCKITSPDQQVFNLRPGRITERYMASETDFNKLKCGMEIKLLLRDDENGMWRCESDQAGAFIDVGAQAKIDYQKYSKKTTRIGEKLLILCEVPFYSSFCHIKAPNGTRYLVKNRKEQWLGRCSFEIQYVNVTDNGTWTCSYARTGGVPDEEILVEVTVADVLLYNPDVKATEDYSFNILCIAGLPLDYCQFSDPNGKSYSIDNNVNSTDISYYGQGLEHGECGIKISNAANSDSGAWSCILQIISDTNKELTARISVEVSPNLLSGSNLALALGVTFGVVAITSLFALIAIRTIRQRRRARLDIAPTQPLTYSSNQDEVQADIFSLNFPSHTNSQIVRDDNHPHQY